ncbi:MAG: hypothetical protein EP322_00115, partial [Bacteroidetes bacterium]
MKVLSSIRFILGFAAVLFVSERSVAQTGADCSTAVTVSDLTGVVCATASPSTNQELVLTCQEGTAQTWFQFTAQGGTADITVSNATAGWRPEFVVISSSDNT